MVVGDPPEVREKPPEEALARVGTHRPLDPVWLNALIGFQGRGM
jgi:hypothetical protein